MTDEQTPTMKEQELINKIVGEMMKNPKVVKAVEGLLSQLKQEGDTLTIKCGGELK